MTVAAVVDNEPCGRLVRRIITDPGFEVYDGRERSTAIMTACGSLSELMPTVLLLDSDTLEERLLRERQHLVNLILNRSSGRTPYRLILAVPQVETILFSDRAGFEKALGRKVADLDWFEARFRPRAVFRRLLGDREFEKGALEVINALDEATLRRMARHPIIREIRGFMAEVQPKRARVRRAG
ncbi:MAG: hypothetical protein ACJ8GN_14470 [Longimicrobiaceae bacterium]